MGFKIGWDNASEKTWFLWNSGEGGSSQVKEASWVESRNGAFDFGLERVLDFINVTLIILVFTSET